MSQPPADWYPDPGAQGQLRYWDGTQWTTHVTAVPHPSTPGMAPAKRGLSTGAIVAISIGAVVLVFAILIATAIPTFISQKRKEAEVARDSVQAIGLAVEGYGPAASDLVLEQMGSSVTISNADGVAVATVPIGRGVVLQGFTTYNSGEWCVWVKRGATTRWHYSSAGGVLEGPCP